MTSEAPNLANPLLHTRQQSSLWPDTDWDKILALHDPAAYEEALSDICQTYRKVIWRAVCRIVSASEAEDVTHDFLSSLIRRDTLSRANPELGKFRHYVGHMLKQFLRRRHRDALRAKRGGGSAVHVAVEDARESELAHDEAGTEVFDREWASELMGRVISYFKEDTRPELLRHVIEEYLSGGSSTKSSASLGQSLGIEAASARSALSRLRQKFEERLRQEVALTTVRSEIDDELRYLLRVLSAMGD